MSQKVLDLHHLKFNSAYEMENTVALKIDKFLYPFLLAKKPQNLKLEIVVGQGLNSSKLIQGKNPLRFYTEEYLKKANLEWQNSQNPGSILIFL